MSGLKLAIVRDDAAGGPPFVYRGEVEVDGAAHAIEARVDAAGASVTLPPLLDEKAARLTRALVRAATKASLVGGTTPPRRIARWRALL